MDNDIGYFFEPKIYINKYLNTLHITFNTKQSISLAAKPDSPRSAKRHLVGALECCLHIHPHATTTIICEV